MIDVVPTLLKDKNSNKKIRFQMVVQSSQALTDNADVLVEWTNADNEVHRWTGKLKLSLSNNMVGHVVCRPQNPPREPIIVDDDLGSVTVTVTGEPPLKIPYVPVVAEVDR